MALWAVWEGRGDTLAARVIPTPLQDEDREAELQAGWGDTLALLRTELSVRLMVLAPLLQDQFTAIRSFFRSSEDPVAVDRSVGVGAAAVQS